MTSMNVAGLLGPQGDHTQRLVNSLYTNGFALDHSETGTGKTHLLYAAYKEIQKTHCALEFVAYSVSRLLKIERDEYETQDEAADRLLTKLSRKRIIFLDDFCAENVTGKTTEFLYCLLDEAISNGKPRIFFTGNQTLKYIHDNISARIASRIAGLCGPENIIKVGGYDRRVNK